MTNPPSHTLPQKPSPPDSMPFSPAPLLRAAHDEPSSSTGMNHTIITDSALLDHEKPKRAPLSPADCCTMRKILDHVASTAGSPNVNHVNGKKGLDGLFVSETRGHLGHGEGERGESGRGVCGDGIGEEDGYEDEDEDGSMELNDDMGEREVGNPDIRDAPSSATYRPSIYEEKENSPSKRRRNAYSRDEISQLAINAEDETQRSVSQESLEKFREMDLTPMDPIMGSDNAGDLILSSTPIKFRHSSLSSCAPRSDACQKLNLVTGCGCTPGGASLLPEQTPRTTSPLPRRNGKC